jgi:decaprenylphospho-beta-D-erythro-pentofuranosid-2-ulose 2-reductase
VKDALGRFQTVLLLGGRSEIGLATLGELLREGPLTAILAARRPDELDTASLESAGATVERVAFDALTPDDHPRVLGEIFDAHGDIDLTVLAFGVLGRQEDVEHDSRAAAELAATNFTGAVSALTVVFERTRVQGHGTIVVLSSVAGERVRRSNYVYGASKAGLDAFTQGLQLAAAGSGVRVLIVRPGFVRTKMTAGLRPAPFSTDPGVVAREIVAAIRRGDEVVWIPRVLRLVMLVVRLLPRRVLRSL